jgi:hypothetical protein
MRYFVGADTSTIVKTIDSTMIKEIARKTVTRQSRRGAFLRLIGSLNCKNYADYSRSRPLRQTITQVPLYMGPARLLFASRDRVAGGHPGIDAALERCDVREAQILQDERRTGAGCLLRSGAYGHDWEFPVQVGRGIPDGVERQDTRAGNVTLCKGGSGAQVPDERRTGSRQLRSQLLDRHPRHLPSRTWDRGDNRRRQSLPLK